MDRWNRRVFLATVASFAGAAALSSELASATEPTPDAMAQADLWARGYLDGYDQAISRVAELNTPSAVVAGALYDFMGRLTTLDEPITISREHTVYAILDAFKAWAADRGLNVEVADVSHWQKRLT